SSCTPPEPASPTEAAPSDPNNPPLTSLPLRLIATNVASTPERSFATIQNTSTGAQGAYWFGQAIPAAGTIKRIKGKFVDFENASSRRIERIALGAADEAPPRPAPTEKEPKAKGGGPRDELAA